MLLPADASIVRRESALPGLATLLDPDAFAAALRSSCPGADITKVRLSKIRYVPTRSCRAAYKVKAEGEDLLVYAKAYIHDSLVNPAPAHAAYEAFNPLGKNRIVLKHLAIVVTIFPHDDTLIAPRQFADAQTRRDQLRTLLPDRPDLWESKVRTLHYLPDARYVVQLRTVAGPKAVLKFHGASDDFDHAARVAARGLASIGPLRLARQIGCSKRHRMLAYEWLEGQDLSMVVSANELGPENGVLVGEALAELHRMDPIELISLVGKSVPTRLKSYAELIGFLCPDLAARLDRLTRFIASQLDERPFAKRLIHGDFHLKQVLSTDQTVAVLDLDKATYGDPAADLGYFMGALERKVVHGILPSDRLDWIKHTLVGGYRSAGGQVLSDSIDLYTAMSLLRSSRRSFRRRNPDWPERTQLIVEQAERLAGGKPSRATLSSAAIPRAMN
jgi:hypothetical protein